jgi:O-antigen/teichoic acid export membrane protein
VAAIPALVRSLGPDRFGLLALAWTLLNYFALFDLGLGRATTRFVSEARGAGRHDEVPRIITGALALQLLLGSAAAALLAMGAPLLAAHVLAVPPDLEPETLVAYRVLALALPGVLLTGSLRGVLEAAGRFDLSNMLRAPVSVANLLLPLAGHAMGLGLPGIVGLLAGSATAGLLAHCVAVARVIPAVRTLPAPEKLMLGRLVRFGRWAMVSSWVGPLLQYLDRFIIGAVAGVGAVAYYAVPFEVVSRLRIIPASLVMTLFPIFSSRGPGAGQDLAPLVSRAVRAVLLTVGPVVMVITGLGGDILSAWIGADFAERGADAMRLLSLGALAAAVALVPFSLLQGLGRSDLPARFNLIELPVHAALSWWLVTRFGIAGAALAWTLRASLNATLLLAAAGSCASLPTGILREPLTARTLLLIVSGIAVCATAAAISPWSARLAVPFAVAMLAVAAWRWTLDASDRERIAGIVRRQLRVSRDGDSHT